MKNNEKSQQHLSKNVLSMNSSFNSLNNNLEWNIFLLKPHFCNIIGQIDATILMLFLEFGLGTLCGKK